MPINRNPEFRYVTRYAPRHVPLRPSLAGEFIRSAARIVVGVVVGASVLFIGLAMLYAVSFFARVVVVGV